MKNFTPLVQELINAIHNHDAAHEDIALFDAPGECHADAFRHFEIDIEYILSSHNTTVNDFNEELSRRVSDKWIYNNLGGLPF